MNKIVKLAINILLFTSIHIQAENRHNRYLIVETSKGKTAFYLESLKLTFLNKELAVTSNTFIENFPLSDISKLYFSEDDITKVESTPIHHGLNNDETEYYDLTGRKCRKVSQGIYIIKNKGKIEKVIIR